MLIALAVLMIVAAALAPRIPQDPAYHNFADQRLIFGVPNFWNVASNVPFLFVGVFGLMLTLGAGALCRFILSRERWPYAVLFAGVVLTCFGSGYYHWSPNNATLLWDRLPMAIGFMGLFAATVAERIDVDAGVRLLPWAVLTGVASVLYWYVSELRGVGDLRPYAVVQYGSLTLFCAMLALFAPRYSGGRYFAWVLGLYSLAKVLEFYDAHLYRFSGGIISGHSLKHLAAAGSVFAIALMLLKRMPKDSCIRETIHSERSHHALHSSKG